MGKSISKDKQQASGASKPTYDPTQKGEPMRDGEEVQDNSDEHIDQDLPGYPHDPARTSSGRTVHNGSAGAFDAEENSHDADDDDDYQDNDDFAMDR